MPHFIKSFRHINIYRSYLQRFPFQSTLLMISCTKCISWLVTESPGLNPDCLLVICSPIKPQQELAKVKMFALYNGFPKALWMLFLKSATEIKLFKEEYLMMNKYSLYLALPYLGVNAKHMVKKTQRKLVGCFIKDKYVKFNIQFKTTKLSFYASAKEKIPQLSNSYVACHFTNVGKTQCTLHKRTIAPRAKREYHLQASIMLSWLPTCGRYV